MDPAHLPRVARPYSSQPASSLGALVSSAKPKLRNAPTLESHSAILTLPAVAATMPAKEPCRHLFDLPQELLDIIFDLTYSEISPMRLKTRLGWEKERSASMMAGRNAPPWPGSKATEFLVSREYFENATRAFVGNRALVLSGCDCPFGRGSDQYRNMIVRLVTQIEMHSAWPTVRLFWYNSPLEFGRLRSVQVTLKPVYFNAIVPKNVWETLLEEEDFLQIDAYTELTRVRGLQDIIVLPGKPSFGGSDIAQQTAMWEANVQKFGALIKPMVVKAKSADRIEQKIFSPPAGIFVPSAAKFKPSFAVKTTLDSPDEHQTPELESKTPNYSCGQLTAALAQQVQNLARHASPKQDANAQLGEVLRWIGQNHSDVLSRYLATRIATDTKPSAPATVLVEDNSITSIVDGLRNLSIL